MALIWSNLNWFAKFFHW